MPPWKLLGVCKARTKGVIFWTCAGACLHVMCVGLILCRSVWLFEVCEGVPACGACRSYVA